jgi:hypothetical protein
MQIKKRLERLEREYVPEPRRGTLIQLSEFDFIGAFKNKYGGREDSAPLVLRREWDRLMKHCSNRRN